MDHGQWVSVELPNGRKGSALLPLDDAYWWPEEETHTDLCVTESQIAAGGMVTAEFPNGRKMSVPLPKDARDGTRFRFAIESFSDKKHPHIWLTVRIVPESPQQA